MAPKRKQNMETTQTIPGKKHKPETNEFLKYMDFLIKMVELDDVDFKTSARRIFEKKFNQNYIVVKTFKPDPLNGTPNDSLKLLNYFGDQILKLEVRYDSSYRRLDKIMDDAINTNCFKSLKEIKFINAENVTMTDVPNPFKKVQKVTFTEGSLCELIQNFGKNFPNANTLEFDGVKVGDFSDDIKLMKSPKLKNLTIRPAFGQKNLTSFFFNKFISTNLQLQSISIHFCEHDDFTGMDYFELDDISIISELPNLKTLEILFPCNTKVQNTRQIHFKNLTHLHIDLWNVDIHDLSISVDNLHSMKLDWYLNTESVMKFMIRNKSVELLKCKGTFNDNQLKIVEAFASLPKLRDLEISPIYGDPHDFIIELLKSCKSLKKLTIKECVSYIVQQKIDISKNPDVQHQWKIIQEKDSCILTKIIPKF